MAPSPFGSSRPALRRLLGVAAFALILALLPLALMAVRGVPDRGGDTVALTDPLSGVPVALTRDAGEADAPAPRPVEGDVQSSWGPVGDLDDHHGHDGHDAHPPEAPEAAPYDLDGGAHADDDGTGGEDGGDASSAPTTETASLANIGFFTDCVSGSTMFSCGPPAARWVDQRIPVEFCTHQAGRPGSITADQFRQWVREAAEMWNRQGARVGVRYTGDCAFGSRWQPDNARNEIGFDDERRVLSGSTAGLARGSWINRPSSAAPTSREFTEFDIIMHATLSLTPTCFQSVLRHEMGHALGFGHSSTPGDLMYPTFDPGNPRSCHLEASPAEATQLQALYGVNQPPTVTAGVPRTVPASTLVTLSATGADPDEGPVTYEWRQVDGPLVPLVTNGRQATFTAPSQLGAELTFEVTARDRFLAPARDTVTITVDTSDTPPAATPGLERFNADSSLSVGSLGWTAVAGAASYEFCSGPVGAPALTSCSNMDAPFGTITWKTVVDQPGPANARRVFTSGARETSLAACNSAGCSAAGVGPIAGGLRWVAWGVDYDYVGMKFDVPGTPVRWTIAGAVNLSTLPRTFSLWNGTAEDPYQQLLGRCANLPAGSLCMQFLGPNDGRHHPIVTIVSERPGTPTTEHRIPIR